MTPNVNVNSAYKVGSRKPEVQNPNEPDWNAALMMGGVGAIILATVILGYAFSQ